MLRITADDFGICEKINQGIVKAHRAGAVTSASLLITGPQASQAIRESKRLPNLEVGLHLALVEAPTATGIRNSVSYKRDYFPNRPCLYPNWKAFLRAWYLGKIKKEELWNELDLQCRLFQEAFGSIPFLNSTQHLHLFPDISPLIVRLIDKYRIQDVRLFGRRRLPFSIRGIQELYLQSVATASLKI